MNRYNPKFIHVGFDAWVDSKNGGDWERSEALQKVIAWAEMPEPYRPEGDNK